MEKYKLKNMDCASCAAKIEDGVAKLEEVKFVSVNFANSSITIDTDDFQKVKKKINELEPEVEIVDQESEQEETDEEFIIKKELLKIGSIIALLIAGIIFKDSLHDTPYSFAEYIVFISIYLMSGWGVLKGAGKNIIRGQVFKAIFFFI